MRYIYTLMAFFIVLQASAITRYVAPTASGSGNGSSWANASSSLYTILQASNSGDEVWVKEGTYRPIGINASFTLRSGVKLFGGFPNSMGGPTMANRDWKAFPTILTRPVAGGNSALFYLSDIASGTIINGFKIQSAYSGDSGGAIDVTGSNITSGLSLQNISFESCNGTYGGAVSVHLCYVSFTNVTFRACEALYNGGAVNLDAGYATFDNVVFQNNNSGVHGGAVVVQGPLASSGSVIFRNSVFFDNYCINGAGGGVYAESASASFLNCTFVNNRNTYNAGGAIQSYVASGSTNPMPTTTITNCVFWKNTKANNVASDIDFVRVTPAVNYSYFTQNTGGTTTGTYGSTNLIADPALSPFTNELSPAGADNLLGTIDDGIQLSATGCFALIDRGTNSVNVPATDVLGNTRKYDVQIVADSGVGTAPIIDLGAYESQNNLSSASLAGTIGNAHIIPTPQELARDSVSNTGSPAAGAVISWQKSELSSGVWGTWVAATPASSLPYYRFGALTKSTRFRRVATYANYCNRSFTTDYVEIGVIQSNGNIQGKVTSNNGVTGVGGINITVVRTTNVSGSPTNFTYTTVTAANDGTFNFTNNPIYYGDNTVNTTSANFTITASKQNHVFEVASVSRTLGTNGASITDVSFKDLSTYSASGKVYQEIVTSGQPTQTCPVGGISMYKQNLTGTPEQNTYLTVSSNSGSEIGTYGFTILDPTTVTYKPLQAGHTYSPISYTDYINSDLVNRNFKDVTTHTISGRITAGIGCSNTSGYNITNTAKLRFYSKTPNGDTCFSIDKDIVVSDNGSFSVTLPARKYFVQIINFTSRQGADVNDLAVKNFINALPIDSLSRDITNADSVLNLVYVRPPMINVTGLPIVCTTPRPFARIQQAFADSFYVTLTQGNSSYGCPFPLNGDTFTVRTNVTGEDGLETRGFTASISGTKIILVGGTPNITPNDYLKDLFIDFTDKDGRNATQFSRKVLVTGIKTDPGTFTTVSPQVPLLVLHDPPGDLSYSEWQQNKTIETAMRLYSGSNTAVGGWLEAKIGTKFMAGIGVSTETEIWGSINAAINTNIKNTQSGEAILSTTTSQTFSTSNNSAITGSQGDVYIGAAMNLKYATATDISFDNCVIKSTKKLAVANDGFSTQYIYTESHIRQTIIPQLNTFISLSTDSAAIRRYQNQIAVWQEVLANNAANKARAAFVENHSFNGAAGQYDNTTSISSTKSSTIEFNMDIESSVIASLGLEIAGNGANAGTSVAFKMETGNSSTNTVTNETSIKYVLDDDDDADFFSVDVKKDPVYNTPCFDLVAGTASCPNEDGAQPRSDVFFTATNPVIQNVPAAGEAIFRLKVVNTSPSHEPRSYQLLYDQSSNVDNETIKIAGSSYVTPVSLGTINYLDSSVKTVSVTRSSNSSVYSYEGVKFIVKDDCGDIAKNVTVKADFVAPCSTITLALPEDNWLVTKANNNLLTVKPGSYNAANLTSVTLEYSKAGTSNWSQGPVFNTGQLANGLDWNVNGLQDDSYNVRLKLECSQGTVYSQRSSGIIDRTAPSLYGKPEPTDDNYINGDIISYAYTENIGSVDSTQVIVRRLSNNSLLPFSVSSYNNKLAIVPGVNIAQFIGDSVLVIVKNIKDQYGNMKVRPDTIKFLIGNSPTPTGNNVMNLMVANNRVSKNSDSTITFTFSLPAAATDSVRVNYVVGGTARYGVDYTVEYIGYQPLYTYFNGTQGAIRLPKNTSQVVMRIRPISDTALTADKTVTISVAEGSYLISNTDNIQTGTITSEDGIYQYTFNGDGNYNVKTNWLNGKMPLTTLAPGKTVIIDPIGVCNLNVPVTIKPTATLRVMPNKQLIIPGNLKITKPNP